MSYLKNLLGYVQVCVVGSKSFKDTVKDFLEANMGKSPSHELATEVHNFVLAYEKYVRDADGEDIWQDPLETIEHKMGDCDDWAGLIFYLLYKLKFKHIRMGIFTCPGNGHMSVLWYEDQDNPWVLDSTGAMTNEVIKLANIVGWTLKASFDEENEWEHDN